MLLLGITEYVYAHEVMDNQAVSLSLLRHKCAFSFVLSISSILSFCVVSPPAAYIKLAEFTSDEVTTYAMSLFPPTTSIPLPFYSLSF